MGTVVFAVGLFSCLLMYYFASNNVAFHKRLAQNHHEINIYKGYEDPHVKKLISDFKEKYPFSVEELNKLSGKKLENYVEATENLLEAIRKYVGQKNNQKDS